MIDSLTTPVTGHRPPTLADIEQRSHDPITQAGLHSQHQTVPASHEPAPQPQHSDQAVFEQYALYGLAGEAVRALAPHTEAQPEAILLQLLAAFGNIIGPGPHCMVGATRHTLNLFLVLVGESSKARKGTSWNQIARLFAEVDPTWTDNRVISARLTARGLIGIMGQQAGDRRLLVLAEELASVLHTMDREMRRQDTYSLDGVHFSAIDMLSVHHSFVNKREEVRCAERAIDSARRCEGSRRRGHSGCRAIGGNYA